MKGFVRPTRTGDLTGEASQDHWERFIVELGRGVAILRRENGREIATLADGGSTRDTLWAASRQPDIDPHLKPDVYGPTARDAAAALVGVQPWEICVVGLGLDVPIPCRASTIADMRKALGLSQERLAERLGVAVRMVARWESGDAKVPLGVHDDLLVVLLDFQDDIERVRRGEQPEGSDWAPVVRFWAAQSID